MPKPQKQERQRVETIGDRVGIARRRLGLETHRDILPATLAGMIDVAPSTISRLESGAGGASEELIQKLAKVLNVSAAWLRYGAEALQPIPIREPTGGKGGADGGE